MRERIESALEAWGYFSARRAGWVISAVVIAIGLGAAQIPSIEVKASTDDFLRRDDPVRIAYNDFLARFGRDDMAILAIQPPAIFDHAFLEKLKRLHEELEDRVPHLHEVQSLVNARETRGEQDTLIVGELLERWPDSAEALGELRARALANPLYPGFLLSEDATLTTVTLELEAYVDLDEAAVFEGFDPPAGGEAAAEAGDDLDSGKLSGVQEAEAVEAIRAIAERYEAPDFRIYAGGAPILNTMLMASMMRDIVLFTLLCLAAIAIVLAVIFRQVLAVVVPLIVSVLSVIATLGVMGAVGIPAMPISEIIPSFLLAVGVGGSVHLLVIFQQRLAAGAAREDAIAGALAHSGLPIIMTALTTAGGLASFAAAAMVPVAVFGTIAPLGILLTLSMTLTLAPALLAVLPLRSARRSLGPPPRSIRILVRAGDFATANAPAVLLACVLLLVVAFVGMLRLQFGFNSLDWFPDEEPAKVASMKLDAELGGAMSLELLIDSGRENGLHDPELLGRIDRARRIVSGLTIGNVVAGKSVSLVDIVQEIHQALNGGHVDMRVIPHDTRLVAQELLLFENSGSDDLEDVVDSSFQVARYTLRVPFVDGSEYPVFGDEVLRIFDRELDGRAQTSATGLMVVMGRSFGATIETMVRSYGIALAVITPLMMLLLGSFRLGMIAMIPNLFPIALTMGMMGWLGIPIEMFSLLIGTIALGLAVDDTIHFMHGFRRHYGASGDVAGAVRQTLSTTGQALLFTSVVLSLAFSTYLLSDLSNLRSFGLLTAFAIVAAFLSDVLMAPALMQLTARFSSLGAERS